MGTVPTEGTGRKWKPLIVLWFLIAIVGTGAMPGEASAQFFSDRDACGVYATLLQDASFLNRDEISVRIRRVYELARGGDVKVWNASRAALTAVTSGGQGLSESLDGLSQACHDKGSPFFHNWQKASTPQTAEDADRFLRGGDPKAKCTKKQYGTGWVSVCE